MHKYTNLSKLDRVLLPFILFNNDFSIINVLRRATKSISSMLFELDTYQKNIFMKLVYYFLFSLLSLVVYPVVLVVAILATVVVSVLNSVVALVIVLGLALYYGLLPFLIKTKESEINQESKERPQFKGYHKLKTPMFISISLLKRNGYYFRHTGLAPWFKLKELIEDGKTHILHKFALSIASIIAVLLYASILFVITDFLVSLFLIIVGFLSGTLWLFINIGANFFNQMDDDNDEEDVKDKEEPKEEVKPEPHVESEVKVEEAVKKEVIEPEVVNDTPRDLNNKEDK